MEIIRIHAGSKETPPATVVGAKAANLARMAALGLPVPPAFVLPIELCGAVAAGDAGAREQLAEGLAVGIEFLEKTTDTKFGDRRRPLLVSVRSGAARSMPGMLDTVLDVGCTPTAVQGLVRRTGNPRFAFDCRRRFLEAFASVVLGLDGSLFKKRLHDLIEAESVGNEQALDGEALERLVVLYERAIEGEGHLLPEFPMEQLRDAAEAVYRSWMSERAVTYRRLQHLDELKGTAVTVQAMVFGNGGSSSGAGVAFSRDPLTGANLPVVDVLFGAQGEDVVSGRRTPETEDAIIRSSPKVAAELRDALIRLEVEFGDVQDVEFTIENDKLWILQTRSAKRTPWAALQFAVDFVREGRLTSAQALQLMQDVDLTKLTSKRLVDAGEPIARGTGASAGVAVGRAAFDSESAVQLSASGDPIILVRPDTNTADVGGFAVSAGIVTAVGGRTAHAALVARQLDKPCIVGCAEIVVDVVQHRAHMARTTVKEGDWLSIDGRAGAVYLGRVKVVADRLDAQLAEIEHWRAAEREIRPVAAVRMSEAH